MKDNRQQIMTLAEQRVRLLYSDAYDQAMKIAEVRNALNAATDENFTFKANPGAERKLRKILEELGIKLDKLIANGKQTLAKDGLKIAEANVLAKVAGSQKPIAERLIQAAATANRVAQALGTEIANEKRGGVNLSPKVWKTVETSRKELEIIIQNNIIEGKGADVASREVRQYLKDPNRLFRRVKDKETGEYRLSKAAQQYHPGRGKYRSSYMNARRLTVTEMNMATQAAESAAYASNPLIAGYEIRLSNNHTVKDPSKKGGVKPLHDICDELQGNYPPTFKFTGWHPHCRCSMIPILISPDERRKLAQARAEGKTYQPKGTITDVPDNYKQWVADNMDRIENAKTLPYFLQDNGEMTEDGYKIGEFGEGTTNDNKMAMQNVSIVNYLNISEADKKAMTANIRAVSDEFKLFDKNSNIIFSAGLDEGTLMGYNGSTLTISTARYRLPDGGVFCPAEQLNNALNKIKAGENLTFNEEYAVESLYHESVHASATGTIQYKKNTIGNAVYETCTQLYAREKYVKLLGGVEKSANVERIRANGYGYREPCNILREVFTKDGKLQLGELKSIANQSVRSEEMLKILCKKRGFDYDEICDKLSAAMIP